MPRLRTSLIAFTSIIAFVSLVSSPLLASGPDVIVGELTGPGNYGTPGSGPAAGIYYAYSLGTTSCNLGDTPLSWIAGSSAHPVIAQHLYRLENGRLEQIGLSWLKHGFTALQGNACGAGCAPHPNGTQLGLGCSDPYSAGLNGSQGNANRYEVNAATGVFPYPPGINPPIEDSSSRRLRVKKSDIDPALHPTARFFAEGHYVAADDAAAGNHHNNASLREVQVASGTLALSFLGATVRERLAIEHWGTIDPTVQLTDLDDGSSGRLVLATRVEALAGGLWSYEYALHNMNSDRCVRSFVVPIPTGVVTQNPDFHDVDSHSGSPTGTQDWQQTLTTTDISWSTGEHAVDPAANALRWGTMYNFRFLASAPPAPAVVTLGLFKPGTTGQITALTQAPTSPGATTPPPRSVTCVGGTGSVTLSWNNAAAYDSILLLRDGTVVATLPGSATGFVDTGIAVGSTSYRLHGVLGGVASSPALCMASVLPAQAPIDLVCLADASSVTLTWLNQELYDQVELLRDGQPLVVLSGSTQDYQDQGLYPGAYTYQLSAQVQGQGTAALICSANVLPPPPLDFTLAIADRQVTYDLATGAASFTVPVLLEENPQNPGFPNPVEALSVAMGHDQGLLQGLSAQPGVALTALRNGAGPEFFAPALVAGGVTVGVVFSLQVTESLLARTPQQVLLISYATNPLALAGNGVGVITQLTCQDGTLGAPPVLNRVLVGIQSLTPACPAGTMVLDPLPTGAAMFVRGDSDGDGDHDLGDAIENLSALLGQHTPACADAMDVNDDGSLDISDPVLLLGYLFLSTSIPGPHPGCGSDGSPDTLTCGGFPGCP